MTDWNNPSTSQTHSNELAATKGRDESVAVMDFSSDSNIPDGTIRWNATAQRFEIWDATGTSWNELVSKYLINVDQLDGRDAGNASGDVPISNGTLNTNLNADQLDGQHGAFYDDAPNGTVMVFYQSAAPTGWTQDTSVNDRVLQVTSGSGGGTGGGWTITGLGHNISVDGHALTTSEIPSHSHNANTNNAGDHSHNVGGSTGGGGAHSHNVSRSNTGGSANNLTSASVGDIVNEDNEHWSTDGTGNHSHNVSGNTNNTGAHSHNVSVGNTGGDGSHSHNVSGGVNHDGNWRPSRIDVIVATRSK